MKKAYLAVLAGTLVALVLCVIALALVRPRFVMSVDGFEINGKEDIAVGRGSGICIDGVPHDFLNIKRDGGSLSWEVDAKCVKDDSLCYFKINNQNPNLHPIGKGQKVVVECDGKRFEMDYPELKKLLAGHKSQYVMLRNVLEKRRQQKGGKDGDFRRKQQIKSFFYREKKGLFRRNGPWQLVILDKCTTLQDGATSVGYTTSGMAGKQCKVQFFKMAEYSFQSDDNDIFRIGDVNYMAKPVLVPTSWGAGHVMVSDNDGSIAVGYPKPLTYTEDCGTLRQMAAKGTSMISLVQDDGSLPVGQNLYMPQFSTDLRHEVGHLFVDTDSITIDGNEVKARLTAMPQLMPVSINAGKGVLHIHTGIIGFAFILSYLWLPLIVFLIVFFSYPMFVSIGGMSIRGKTLWADRLPMLFACAHIGNGLVVNCVIVTV